MNDLTLVQPFKRSDEVMLLGSTLEHSYLRAEAELVTLKWPAYRFFSPRQLNELFKNAYNERIIAISPRNPGGGTSYVGGISKKLNIWTNNHPHTQLHLARQHADRTGMPYDEYLRFCFDFANRRERNFVPRPNQLRPNAKSEEAWLSMVIDYWSVDRMTLELARARHMPEFALENARGLPAQTWFTDTLMWLAGENLSGLASFIGNFVLSRRWLSEDPFATTYPQAIEQAKSDAERLRPYGTYAPEPVCHLSDDALRQSCFGLPGIDTDIEANCRTCPARNACSMLRSETLDRLQQKHGAKEPVAEMKRRKTRERVTKHRRAKTMATLAVDTGGGCA